MASFITLETYENNDENMMYWMGKGEVSKKTGICPLVYIEPGPGLSGKAKGAGAAAPAVSKIT